MIKLIFPSEIELRKVTVKDNSEGLVDLRIICPNIIFNIAWYIKRNGGQIAHEQAHFAREEVAKRLNIAQSLLSKSYHLMIDNAYRSPKIQKKSYDNILKRLKSEQPNWSDAQLEVEMTKRVSKVEMAPHCTGGAIDLTIVNKEGSQLDMGTSLDEFTESTYTHSDLISPEAKKNRKLLINIMTKAGFINFPAEWWHWSYGEREWAYYQKDKTAFYDVTEKKLLNDSR